MPKYSSDFGAPRLDPCELRTVVPYTYTLSERSAKLHGRRSGGIRLTVEQEVNGWRSESRIEWANFGR
ncbi:hypothetical protein EVAR_37949_1 [Eumeta japonica]|uniref:Uncharacterized protein n=1 Tax=Eumeta variegata TaxID=151549 RepID=A0A4C1XGT8_EUMVA|nr:hypothetical protein EVAR_37949_1 [Eumeta japonica]